jgi:hypothetical protein
MCKQYHGQLLLGLLSLVSLSLCTHPVMYVASTCSWLAVALFSITVTICQVVSSTSSSSRMCCVCSNATAVTLLLLLPLLLSLLAAPAEGGRSSTRG